LALRAARASLIGYLIASMPNLPREHWRRETARCATPHLFEGLRWSRTP